MDRAAHPGSHLPRPAVPGQRLPWPACRNARDLGGYPLEGDHTSRWGTIVRADDLGRLTAEGWATVEAYGIRTIIDLRHDAERRLNNAAAAQSRAERSGIEVLSLPLFEEIDRETAVAIYTSTSLLEAYRVMLQRCRAAFASVMRRLADPRCGPAVVHCQSGRDRTGLVSALLLSVSGASVHTVAADYARSVDHLAIDTRADASGSSPTTSREAAVSAMLELLDWVGARWGDAAGYLRACAVSDEELERVQARLRPERP